MAPLEPFFVQMKISLITGLALAFPVILYQMWLFLAPALYPKERKIIYYFLPVGTVAFVLGDLFFLKLVWPLVISFSLRYESEFLFSMLNLTQFVNFCLRLLVLFGLIFELPLILLILARVGMVGWTSCAASGGWPSCSAPWWRPFTPTCSPWRPSPFPCTACTNSPSWRSGCSAAAHSRGEDLEPAPAPAETGLGPPSAP